MKFKRNSDWKTIYSEYLKTPHWQRKKLEITAHCFGQCVRCHACENLEIHHTLEGYDELFAEVPGVHAFVLCDVCHDKHHSDRPTLYYFADPDKVWQFLLAHNNIIKHEPRTISTTSNNPNQGRNEDVAFGYVEAVHIN